MREEPQAHTNPQENHRARRVLAFGDIHQAPNLHEIESAIEGVDPDITVFLGDYFDSFIYDYHDHVRRTANWLKDSLHRRDRIHLFGNHDIPYAFPYKATCPGWTPEKHRIVRSILEDYDWQRMRLMYSPAPSWLYSHAGVSASLAVEAKNGDVSGWCLQQESIALSFLATGQPHWTSRGGNRRGENRVGGCLWCDWSDFEPISGLNQVLGHTPSVGDAPPIRVKHGQNSINLCIDATGRAAGVSCALLWEEGTLSEILIPTLEKRSVHLTRGAL